MCWSPIVRLAALALVSAVLCVAAPKSSLPGGYFAAMEEGVARVQARLDAEPRATLRDIEETTGWRHFPHAILAAAVLYTSKAPENRSQGDPKKLALAIRIGDLAAGADERGIFSDRLDSHRDAYMWLEAYRLLEAKLDEGRRARWKACLVRNVAILAARCLEWRDVPAYNHHFLGTSTNHFALWATDVMIAGQLFHREDWLALGRHILRRLATVEQSPDGYWGEYNSAGPTNGYNLLTLSAVGVYWEYARDPQALTALRRATEFHEYFTYPDGQPAETINDRNRYWDSSLYGNFAFTHSPDGRAFARFLFECLPASRLDMEPLGRIAQNALYYHAGPLAAIPQHSQRYAHRLTGPAGIRKSGPWVTALSGLIATQPESARWFLERQSHVSVFHERAGLIITGGNSRSQPELATFSETIKGGMHYLPLWSKLQMGDAADRLWLAYNSFSSEIAVQEDKDSDLRLRFAIRGRGAPPERAGMALQLCLKEGEELVTGTGLRVRLGPEKLTLSPREIGGRIEHHGWKLSTDAQVSLTWPVFPYNP
ncbi:MAG: hypothetical protein ABFD86_09650, partial [Bryobacteraceae bacterium]